MQRTLMLDVDGVLVHGKGGAAWAADIERDLGIDPERLSAEFFRPHWGDVIVGRKPLSEVLEACLPALSPTLAPGDFMEYWFERDSDLDEAVLADARVLRSAGMPVYLATNQEHHRARYLMERMGLGDHVDGIVYSAAIGAKKPDRAFFTAAAKRAGGSPETLILVDDSMANVAAARNAGWTAFHWTPDMRLLTLLEGLV